MVWSSSHTRGFQFEHSVTFFWRKCNAPSIGLQVNYIHVSRIVKPFGCTLTCIPEYGLMWGFMSTLHQKKNPLIVRGHRLLLRLFCWFGFFYAAGFYKADQCLGGNPFQDGFWFDTRIWTFSSDCDLRCSTEF